MWHRIACAVLTGLLIATPAFAKPREARIPLRDGKIRTADLTAALCREMHLPEWELNCAEIDFNGMRGSLVVAGLNASLDGACKLSVGDEALVIQFDSEKLPEGWRGAEKAVRVFTAVVAPEATARQRARYGLWAPPNIDTRKPLVVLVHGLDCDRLNWVPMIELLHKEGRQVALFTYPSDQPIADSAREFGAKLAELRLNKTGVSYDVICHSMGGLVAREYVESESYRGGVERLIMLGTPNRGTDWAGYRWTLELNEHYSLWKHDPNWSPSWMITDGFGEAGDDLKPHSAFLTQLNARPRRESVKYTIIAGNLDPVRRVAANGIEATSGWIPNRVSDVWGFRQTKHKLQSMAEGMRENGGSDGPVGLTRCKLKGVEDFVVVACDHAGLCFPTYKDKPPAAWETIRDRLNR